MQISFGGKIHSFDEAQDDGGMDCGAALRETSIQIKNPTTRWCTLKVRQLVEGSLVEKDQTVGVCHVKAGSPQIDCFTILNGIDSLQYPLLGRFILHDSSIRRYVGALVPPTSMVYIHIEYYIFLLFLICILLEFTWLIYCTNRYWLASHFGNISEL